MNSTVSGGPDPYALVLADLKAKRAEIDRTIELLEGLRGGVGAAPPRALEPEVSAPEASLGAGSFLGMSIPDAAKKALASQRRAMGNAEIAKMLKEGGLVMTSADPVNTVGSVLTRRFKQVGDIVRVSRGTWGLKEWYPNRNFHKPDKGSGEEPSAAPTEQQQPSGLSPNDDSDQALDL